MLNGLCSLLLTRLNARRTLLCAASLLFLALTSCTSTHPTSLSSHSPQTLLADPARQPPVNLLSFESDTDLSFVTADPLPARLDRPAAHSGASSLLLPAGTREFRINLASLLRQRDPKLWPSIGAHFYSQWAISITAQYLRDGKIFSEQSTALSPGKWSLVSVDIPSPAQAAGSDTLAFTLKSPGHSDRVWCDDLVLADNTQILVPGKLTGRSGDHWTLRKRGSAFEAQHQGRFNFSLTSADVNPNGWSLEESNELRALFSSKGPTKFLAAYADGRSYWDGRYRPLGHASDADAVFDSQHRIPAILSVSKEEGRINRTTPGDANNDGYNELRGSYELAASGARLEITLTPRTAVVINPVLEIAGMPPGAPIVTIEGRLVDDVLRLPSGSILAIVPAEIERSTTISVRVQP
jgi:hypothetical protein